MSVLGKAAIPSFWTSTVRDGECFRDYRRECLEYYESQGLENFGFPAITYSKFKLFFTTGDREIYQKIYFDRRAALEYTVPLALMYPDEEKYINTIMDAIFVILDEYTWCLPAHQGELDKANSVKIDLFTAETGFWLSLIDSLLGERLDPLIRERIRIEIDRRVINPFLAVESYDWWESSYSNWTAVCTSGVAACFMLVFPELMTKPLIERFNRAMESFIGGFLDDGICFEGCSYWMYGVGNFVMYADMLYNFTNGEYNLFAHPKLPAIASFPQKMFLSKNCAVSFADSSRSLSYHIGILHRLKKEYGDKILVYSPSYANFGYSCGRMGYRLFAALWLCEEYYENPADDSTELEFFASESEWFVKKTGCYGFAAKGGCNDELHNHNDVGSFIFAKNGRQLLCDLGSGLYTRQYFAPATRYSVLECSSLGHSVPIIAGEGQKFGREFCARDVRFADGCLSMDISGAYGNESVGCVRRSFYLSDDSITLVDEYERRGKTPITERFVSIVTPEIRDTGAIQIGEATLKYDESLTPKIVKTSGTSPSNKTVYFIDFELDEGVDSFRLTLS